MRIRSVAVLCASCAVAALAGCVERVERFTIRPDGSTFLELNYSSGSLDDIYSGDAVPTPGNGWVVEERAQQDDEGKTTYVFNAVLVVDAGAPLPSTYAPEGNAEASGALRFPTELIVESRGAATYYHFHRRYEPRRWAYVDLKRRELIDEPLKSLEGKDVSELSANEHTSILRGFAQFEIEKALIMAREAHLEVAPELPQDWWLALESDLRTIVDEIDYTRLIEITSDPDDEARSRQFGAEVTRWQIELEDRLERGAKLLVHYSPSQLKRFLAVYATKKAEFAVSEDLGDDVFKIDVDMPGEIIATNAPGRSGSAAHWEFSGQQLRDDAVELMVTSVVR